MRRKDREITEHSTIREIINKADVVRLAMFDGVQPYIVPLNFGYTENEGSITFYMHCANEGRKIDILKINPQVCFELDTDHLLKQHPNACGWSMYFKSVIGYGKVEIISNTDEKIKGLSVLMDHYDSEGISKPYDFSHLIDRTTILKLTVDSMTCKVKNPEM